MFIGLFIPTIPEIKYAISKSKIFGVQIKLGYIEGTDNTSWRKTINIVANFIQNNIKAQCRFHKTFSDV